MLNSKYDDGHKYLLVIDYRNYKTPLEEGGSGLFTLRLKNVSAD